MQTIPHLALFGFLIPLPFIGGIGRAPRSSALVFYACCPSFATRSPEFWRRRISPRSRRREWA